MNLRAPDDAPGPDRHSSPGRPDVTANGVFICPNHREDKRGRLGQLNTMSFGEMWGTADTAMVGPRRDCAFFCARHDATLAIGRVGSGSELTTTSAPSCEVMRIAVVGAGPAGLTSARQALAQGHGVTVYEKHAAAGGVWSPGSGGACPSVRMQSSRMSFPFSGFPPLAADDLRSLHQVHEYLASYAAAFGVPGVTRLRHRAVRVARKDGGDCQATACPAGNPGAAATEDYDAVLVAQGELWRPRRPSGPPLAGIRALTAKDYRVPEVFRGQRGLVVGGGVSGADIASATSGHAAAVDRPVRRRALFLPRQRPLCTVIVPTYNRSGLLRHTLDALVRQTLGTRRFEVIVVDDGSSDDTTEVVADYSGQLNVSYYFQPDQGYRVAAVRNLGVRHARAPICVFVDSGVILHSGALDAYLRTHQQAARPVAVIGYVYCFNEDNEDGEEILAAIDFGNPDATMASLGAQGKWLDIREEFYAKYGDDFADLPAPWPVYWACNVSVETSQLIDAGMFDEWFRTWGAEDLDVSYRLHRRGVRFVLCREACSIHVPHPKSHRSNMQSVVANYHYFAAKYGTPITRLVIDHHVFAINDVIREKNLPDCADYLAGRSGPQ